MPRPRARVLFTLGKYWIAREPGAANLYRYWTDAGTGRTRRASLGTADLREATTRLAEIVVRGDARTPTSPLSIVLENYFLARSDKLPSAKGARRAGAMVLNFVGHGAAVNALSEAKQRELAEAMIDDGYRLSYVARTMVVVHAALGHAGIKESRIIYTEAQMRDRWGIKAQPARRRRVPSDEDFAALFAADEMTERLRRLCTIMALTSCRPEAAVDLAPGARIHEAGLVDLNPAGRAQTKKYRPTVRAPRALTECLDRWEEVMEADTYCGYASRDGFKSALDTAREAAGVHITAYDFRHKVTTIMRAAGVHEDQVSMQLGHKRPDTRVTSMYGEWSPDYLKDAAAAIDGWWSRLQILIDKIGNSRRTLIDEDRLKLTA